MLGKPGEGPALGLSGPAGLAGALTQSLQGEAECPLYAVGARCPLEIRLRHTHTHTHKQTNLSRTLFSDMAGKLIGREYVRYMLR